MIFFPLTSLCPCSQVVKGNPVNKNTKLIACIDGKYVYRNLCTVCGDYTQGTLCLNCYLDKKAERIPSRETFISELTTNQPIVKLASKYGVSDNAYRKWLTKRGLPAKLKDIKLFISSV